MATLILLGQGPTLRALFNHDDFLRGPSPDTATLGVRASTYELGGTTNIQSMTPILQVRKLRHRGSSPKSHSRQWQHADPGSQAWVYSPGACPLAVLPPPGKTIAISRRKKIPGRKCRPVQQRRPGAQRKRGQGVLVWLGGLEEAAKRVWWPGAWQFPGETGRWTKGGNSSTGSLSSCVAHATQKSHKDN